MNVPLFMARRFMRSVAQERTISIMLAVCCAGIFIGTSALALVIAIMQGFEYATYKHMKGIHADLIIRSHQQDLAYPAIREVIEKEFNDSIRVISPYRFGTGLIMVPEEKDISQPVTLLGIDSRQEQEMQGLATTIKVPQDGKLATVLGDNRILIGKPKARALDVGINDELLLMFAPEDQASTKSIKLAREKVNVGGMFATGVEDIDAQLVVMDNKLFDQLFPQTGVTEIGLELRPGADALDVQERLEERLGVPVVSWQELYPTLVSALLLERYAMFCVVALITLVASMNIISLLFMYSTYKRGDIAILKALGLADSGIEKIFIMLGVGIAVLSSAAGLSLAAALSFILDYYKLIALPDVYFATHVPAHMSWAIVGMVFMVVVIMSFLASWIPARCARRISVAQVLKFEA